MHKHNILCTQIQKEMTDADLKMVYGELLEETGLAKEQKHFFDTLHVSPLKVHLRYTCFSIKIRVKKPIKYVLVKGGTVYANIND